MIGRELRQGLGRYKRERSKSYTKVFEPSSLRLYFSGLQGPRSKLDKEIGAK
jgi:hypothetical protein